jgi:hypothetical protein
MATPTLFQRGHLWLRDEGETEITLFGGGDFNRGLRYADEIGWTWCLKVQDGQSERNVGLAQLIRSRRQALGLRQFPILGWSTNRDKPKDDAEKTNGLIIREKLQGFISECETYKGQPGTEPYNRLKIFMDRALAIEPLRTTMLVDGGWGFCYLPNEPAGPYMDWGQVSRGKGRGVPECYPNEFPDAPSQTPHTANKLAVDSGYSDFYKSYMHPVVGAHPGVQPWRMQAYCDSLVKSKREGYFTYGFGVYGTNHLTGADRTALYKVTQPAGTTGVNVLAWY